MGIRINKEIGYFLSAKQAKKLLIADYEEFIDEMDEKAFFASLINSPLVAEIKDVSTRIMVTHYLKHAHELFKEKKLNAYQLFSSVYFGDNYKGILFQNYSMATQRRYDNDIDYYENNRKMSDRIKKINSPIYPSTGYIYEGGLEDIDAFKNIFEEDIALGSLILEEVSLYAFLINKHFYGEKKKNDYAEDTAFLMTNKGFFRPKIEDSIFYMSKIAGILKPEVTKDEFERALQGAICTTWR